MKKFYILLVSLFIINGASGQGSIPVLSVDASAQGNHSAFDLQHQTLNSMENVQGMMGNKEWKASNIIVEKKSREPIKHQQPERHSLIQIFDSIYYWSWDVIIGWEISSKSVDMVYDANNNLISYVHQIWNGSAWENNEKHTYSYNANNNQTSDLYQIWTGSAWENSTLNTIIYDTNNNLTNYLEQKWIGGIWQNYNLETNTYNANNDLTILLYQNWDGSAWVNDWQNIITYDSSNNQTNVLSQVWQQSAWEDGSLETDTYDVNNNLTILLYQEWNGSDWVNYFQNTYTYDVNNKWTITLRQNWGGNIWVNSFLYTCTYDNYNNQTSILGQEWDSIFWVNSCYFTYTYDVNNFKISDSYKQWDNAGTIIEYGDSTYYYFHTVVGIDNILSNANFLMIYPNPAFTTITLEAPTVGRISITNLSGQQLFQQEINELTTTVDISTLPSGVYFVRLTDDKTVAVGKIVKQ